MRTRYLYLDANGTLFTNRTETGLWKDVGNGLRKYYKENGNRREAARLWRVKYFQLAPLVLAYTLRTMSEPEFEERMYDIFNPRVLQDAPYDVVKRLVEIHAREKATQKVQRPTLETLREFKGQGGTPTIVSTGCREKIADALYWAGFVDVFPEWEIVANKIEHANGRVVRFPYDGIRPEAEVERLMADRGQNPGEVACMVHDYRGLPVAEKVQKRGGRVLIPADADKRVMDRAITLRAEHWEHPDQLRGLLLE